ncbi:MAG: hypothetical protein PHO45_07185, partial [Victivallaceae bacterium]|nr:hypothetical protein [Victivallaceae bacterium]
PLFRTESAQALMKHVEGYISLCEKRGVEPCICFYMHPWEFAKMPEGLLHYGEGAVLPDPFIIKNCGSYAKEQLDILIDMLRERGSEFLQARKVKVK